MPQPVAEIIDLADALVDAIESEWDDSDFPRYKADTVERQYIGKVCEGELNDMEGRRIIVMIGDYGDNPETRGADRFNYDFTVVIAERCLEEWKLTTGEPKREWMDERVNFVRHVVNEALDYDGRSYLTFTDSNSVVRRVFTSGIETESYDEDLLNTHGLFYSTLRVEMFEDLAVS